jgi:hypothetical protein
MQVADTEQAAQDRHLRVATVGVKIGENRNA